MKIFWKFAPTTLALGAMVLVLVQTVRLNRLQKQVGARPHTAAAADADHVARLEKRIASLEQATRRLVGLALTRRGNGPQGRTGPDPVLLGWLKNEVKTLRDDVDSVIAGEKIATPQGKKKLKDLLRNVQKEDRQERRQRWKAMAQYMQSQTLKRFADDAKVDPATVQKIDSMLSDERAKLRDIWRGFRSGDKDVASVVADARKLVDATDAQARELLTSDQYRQYEDLRKDMPGMRWLRRLGGRK